MARHFNGTSSDRASVAIDLSAYNKLTISFRLWWDAYANNDALLCEYTANTLSGTNAGFFIDPNTANVGFQQFSICQGFGGSKAWQDIFTRPSAAAWHHYLITFDRTTPVNTAWVDGVTQTLTTVSHTGSAFGNFSNSTLNLMCRNQASLFGAGRLAEWVMWGGVILGGGPAKALAAGTNPYSIHPENIIDWTPFQGDSPEPDYSGNRKNVTIVGTTVVAHPPVRPGIIIPHIYGPQKGPYTLSLAATSGAEASTLVRVPAKILSLARPSSSSLVRAPSRVLAVADAGVAALLRQPSRTLTTTEGHTTSIIRNPGKILSSSGTSLSSLIRAPQRLLTYVVTTIASLIRNPSRSITSTGIDTTSLKKQPSHILTTTGGDSSLLSRTPSTVLTGTAGSSSSVVRSPLKKLSSVGIGITSLVKSISTTILAILHPDGVISGGIGSAFTGLQIQASIQRARLNGLVGGMVINNFLLVSAGHPTFDRIDTVWVFSPAGYTGAFSAPNPPGYDVERIEGTPSASPVAPGFNASFVPGSPYNSVGFATPYYYAALFSYRVPAGATASSQFTDFTDLRTIVPDGNGSGGVSLSTLIKQPNRTLTTAAVTVSSLAFTVSLVLAVAVGTVATVVSAVVTGGIVLTCIGAAAVKLIRQPNRTLATSGGDTTVLDRTPGRIISTSVATSSTLQRSISKTLAVVILPVAALKKQVARVLFVSETSIPVVLPVRQKNAILTSTGGDTSLLTRTPIKKLSASGNSISSLRRQVVKILTGIIGDSTSLTRSPSHSLQVTSPASTSILGAVGRTLSSSATGIASIASHVFPFVAHLFAILRVYKQWQFDGYKVYEVNLARQRFDIVASKVYSIGRVFKRWQ